MRPVGCVSEGRLHFAARKEALHALHVGDGRPGTCTISLSNFLRVLDSFNRVIAGI